MPSIIGANTLVFIIITDSCDNICSSDKLQNRNQELCEAFYVSGDSNLQGSSKMDGIISNGDMET